MPKAVEESLQSFIKPNLNATNLKLGDIPHLYSLIPLAQSNACPISKLKGSDGLVGTQFKQQEDFNEILSRITSNIIDNLNAS